MNDSSNWLVHDHRKYEAILEQCEETAVLGEWKEAIRLFNFLLDDLKLHMQMEDEVLYPLFKEQNGDPEDDIAALSEEHDNIVRLLHDLVYIIKTRNYDHFLESLIPLRRVMTRHNEHEEKVFRRMANQEVLNRRDEIVDQMYSLQKKGDRRTWDF